MWRTLGSVLAEINTFLRIMRNKNSRNGWQKAPKCAISPLVIGCANAMKEADVQAEAKP